jgi:hypothetical protein
MQRISLDPNSLELITFFFLKETESYSVIIALGSTFSAIAMVFLKDEQDIEEIPKELC